MTLQQHQYQPVQSWGPLAHHDGSRLYVSNPYPQLGDHVGLRVRVRDSLGVEAVHVRSLRDGDQSFTHAGRSLRSVVRAGGRPTCRW